MSLLALLGQIKITPVDIHLPTIGAGGGQLSNILNLVYVALAGFAILYRACGYAYGGAKGVTPKHSKNRARLYCMQRCPCDIDGCDFCHTMDSKERRRIDDKKIHCRVRDEPRRSGCRQRHGTTDG